MSDFSRSSRAQGGLFGKPPGPPENYLIAYIDGGARGNPGPAGYGVLIKEQSGHKVTALSEYLGHQTNNYAEYSGLLAALEYALENGHRALKVVSDSELMVKQIRGQYKVKSPALLDLYQRAKALIAKLDWFSIQHVLRAQNREADGLANAAMDKGMGRRPELNAARSTRPSEDQEFDGVVRNGVVELVEGELPEGTRVRVRAKHT
jgi:ribonuclease HI